MPRLIYVSFARFPTEKAHGLQITQNCEAFANCGYDVELWVSNRHNTPAMHAIDDVYQHYGVQANFTIRRVPSIDCYPLARQQPKLEYIAFYIHILTYCVMLLWHALRQRDALYYSRDEYALLALSLGIARQQLAFEVHQFAPSKRGAWLQSQVIKRVGSVIAITSALRQQLIDHRGALASQVMVAHDGIRAARFQHVPHRTEARTSVDWAKDAFIVGYMGRLHTMGMDKGVGVLVRALATLTDIHLALVGGPDDMAAELQRQWIANGGNADHFLYAGTVAPAMIPTYLAAFDICAMPFPWTEHYAYYMSPLKLFEYMASGTVILATDLPSVTEVVTHQESAYIVPPDNGAALAQAVRELKADPVLREKLAHTARARVLQHHTWAARARLIITHIEQKALSNARFTAE